MAQFNPFNPAEDLAKTIELNNLKLMEKIVDFVLYAPVHEVPIGLIADKRVPRASDSPDTALRIQIAAGLRRCVLRAIDKEEFAYAGGNVTMPPQLKETIDGPDGYWADNEFGSRKLEFFRHSWSGRDKSLVDFLFDVAKKDPKAYRQILMEHVGEDAMENIHSEMKRWYCEDVNEE